VFDAVAAALGVCFEIQDYEGHAGMALECLARPYIASETGYPVALSDSDSAVISWEPLWHSLLSDVAARVETGRIAARFHQGLIRGCTEMVAAISTSSGVGRVALSGGVMQNQILHEGLTRELEKAGLEVLSHSLVPANDGGLALGQAVIAASSSFSN
jgi:hydrogenase maturation protein HypF